MGLPDGEKQFTHGCHFTPLLDLFKCQNHCLHVSVILLLLTFYLSGMFFYVFMIRVE